MKRIGQPIQIIARDNQYGLSEDIRLLAEMLEAMGFPVVLTNTLNRSVFSAIYRFLDIHFPHRVPWLQKLGISSLRRVYDILIKRMQQGLHRVRKNQPRPYLINIHIEHPGTRYLLTAERNILMPHQEWFLEEWKPLLASFDSLWCKTHYARSIFTRFHPDARFVGFSSRDVFDEQAEKDYGLFFHLAGQSPHKGTTRLIATWERHPQWPRLTIVQHPRLAQETHASNIEHIISRHLPETDLRTLQNQKGIHLCLSEAEGFGHSIGEAMSCAAVVVTVDAPPMNEFIQPERGLLVSASAMRQVGLGESYHFDEDELEATIETILHLDADILIDKGRQARAWFLKNRADFAVRFEHEVAQLLFMEIIDRMG